MNFTTKEMRSLGKLYFKSGTDSGKRSGRLQMIRCFIARIKKKYGRTKEGKEILIWLEGMKKR